MVGRIRAAGGVAAEVFTRQAVTMMHERAQGLPRTISVIADNALLGGYAAGLRPVSADLVSEICRDFDIAAAPGARAPEKTPMTAPPAPSAPPQVAIAPMAGGADPAMFDSFAVKKKRSLFFGNE